MPNKLEPEGLDETSRSRKETDARNKSFGLCLLTSMLLTNLIGICSIGWSCGDGMLLINFSFANLSGKCREFSCK